MHAAVISLFSAPVVLPAGGPAGVASGGSAPFGDLLKDAVTGVDSLQQQASMFMTR
jgi:hypothetical protein